MNHPYLIIKGTATDDVDDANSSEVTFAIKGILPYFEKSGEDKENVTGGFRSARNRKLKFNIAFVSMFVDLDDSTADYGQYWELQKLIAQYEYIWFKETDFVRVLTDNSNLWDKILPLKVELLEDNLTPIFEEGVDELETTWQTRSAFNILAVV